MNDLSTANWIKICAAEELSSFVGVRALLDDEQVAVFKVQDQLYAINAIDPFTNAAVLARGIVGDIQGEPVVASPIYKQHFSLLTGQCLEDESVKVKIYPVRENSGAVELVLS